MRKAIKYRFQTVYNSILYGKTSASFRLHARFCVYILTRMSTDLEALKQALLDTSTQLSDLVADYESLNSEMESTKKQFQALQDACSMVVLPLLHTLFRSVEKQVSLGHHDPQTLKDMSTCFALCDKAARLLQSVNLASASDYFSVKAITSNQLNNEDGTSNLMKYYQDSEIFSNEKDLKEKHKVREEHLLKEIEELSNALVEIQAQANSHIVVDGEEIDATIVRSLLQQVVDSEAQIAALQQQLQNAEVEFISQLKSLRDESESKLKALQDSFEIEKSEALASALQEARNQHFEQASKLTESHESQMKELQLKLDVLADEHREALSAQERKFEEERKELLRLKEQEKEKAIAEAVETTKKRLLMEAAEREATLRSEKEKIEVEYGEYREFADRRHETLLEQMDATAATCESMRNSLLASHEIQERQAHQIMLLQQQSLHRTPLFSPSKSTRLVLSQQETFASTN